ncbi:MAG: response regulator [Chitinophagaceae bacterium]
MATYADNNQLTIVIADDDRDLLMLVKMRLEAEGFKVAISINGEDISRIAVEKHADIILLDISMDGISGEDICKQLKNHKKTSFIPVVLFSANEDIREVAETCGADDYVPKPFSLDLIKEKLVKLIPAYR